MPIKTAFNPTLQHCRTDVPDDYEHVALSRDEYDHLLKEVAAFYRSSGVRTPDLSPYKYWVFRKEQSSIVCEGPRSRRGIESCQTRRWKLTDDSQSLSEAEPLEAICVIGD
jgi:hypothetical protein